MILQPAVKSVSYQPVRGKACSRIVHYAVELQRSPPCPLAHPADQLAILIQEPHLPSKILRISRFCQESAVVLSRYLRNLTLVFDRGDIPSPRRQNTVKLTRNNVSRQAFFKRYHKDARGCKGFVETPFRLKWKEAHIVEVQCRSPPHQAGLFDTVANHNDLDFRSPSQKRGGFHEHAQVLREAEIAGMHHDELIGQPVSL
jgi:hypothetical protein